MMTFAQWAICYSGFLCSFAINPCRDISFGEPNLLQSYDRDKRDRPMPAMKYRISKNDRSASRFIKTSTIFTTIRAYLSPSHHTATETCAPPLQERYYRPLGNTTETGCIQFNRGVRLNQW